MNLRHRAAGLVLSCDTDQIEHQLELLDKTADIGEEHFPPEGVDVWIKYEDESITNLLEIIENNENELKEVWNAALDLAAANAEASIEPVSKHAEHVLHNDMGEEGVDYEVPVMRSTILQFKK